MCKFLQKSQEPIAQALDGKNKEVVITHLALRFQQTFMTVLMRVTVNNTGAMLISRDVNAYATAVSYTHLRAHET